MTAPCGKSASSKAEGAALVADPEDWYDGFRAAIRAVREQTGGGYDADVEREAVAQLLEDALVAHGGKVTAACEPPKQRGDQSLPAGNATSQTEDS